MHEDLKKKVNDLADQGIRLNGRDLETYRDVSVEYGVTKSAEGSARVRIGETEVIAGVKLELMKPYSDEPESGSLMVNVELLPLSSPDFEPGPPSMAAIEYARVTDRGLRESGTIDFKKLCVTKGEQAWMIIIDICSLNDDGNLFDAIPLAALAALKDACYPAIVDDKIDYSTKTKTKLPVTKELPVTVTIFKYGKHLMIDPDPDEMRVYDARQTLTVKNNNSLCSLQKGGARGFTSDDLKNITDLAIKKSKELRSKL